MMDGGGGGVEGVSLWVKCGPPHITFVLNENFYKFSLLYQYLIRLIKPLDHHVSKMYFQFRTRLNCGLFLGEGSG